MDVTRSSLWCTLAFAAVVIVPARAQSPEPPFDQAKALAELRKSIEAREDKPAVDVFMNGSMLGNADYLKELGILDVSEVRYWDAASASARFGMGHPRGVIEITRK